MVQPATHRDREPWPHVNVVLHEYARRRGGIPELGDVGRVVAVVLDRHAANPGVRPAGATHRQFREARVVTVAFEDLPKPVVVPLARPCGSGSDDRAPHDGLPQCADIEPPRFERLAVGEAGRGEDPV